MTKEDIELWHIAHAYEPRTPEYMDAVLAHVKELWKKYPQMRLASWSATSATGTPSTLSTNTG